MAKVENIRAVGEAAMAGGSSPTKQFLSQESSSQDSVKLDETKISNPSSCGALLSGLSLNGSAISQSQECYSDPGTGQQVPENSVQSADSPSRAPSATSQDDDASGHHLTRHVSPFNPEDEEMGSHLSDPGPLAPGQDVEEANFQFWSHPSGFLCSSSNEPGDGNNNARGTDGWSKYGSVWENLTGRLETLKDWDEEQAHEAQNAQDADQKSTGDFSAASETALFDLQRNDGADSSWLVDDEFAKHLFATESSTHQQPEQGVELQQKIEDEEDKAESSMTDSEAGDMTLELSEMKFKSMEAEDVAVPLCSSPSRGGNSSEWQLGGTQASFRNDAVDSAGGFGGFHRDFSLESLSEAVARPSGVSVTATPGESGIPASLPSGVNRIDAWVSAVVAGGEDLEPPEDYYDYDREGGVAPDEVLPSSHVSRGVDTSRRVLSASTHHSKLGGGGSTEVLRVNVADMEYAARVVRSLDRHAAAVYLSGKGLSLLPPLGTFHYLKTLDLSRNAIARMPAGLLPKTLHILDLSNNKLTAIEGLKDLTRLRVLNLSHNKIHRIGHGLSGCSSLRELYLHHNKLGEVEGLHRLLKLHLLDVSSNKVSSTKALSQLAANHASLQSLNVGGNPVQDNMGGEALKKYVMSLLPSLLCLNQRPTKAVSSTRDSFLKSAASEASKASRSSSSLKTSRSSKAIGSSSLQPPSSSRSSRLGPLTSTSHRGSHKEQQLVSASHSNRHASSRSGAVGGRGTVASTSNGLDLLGQKKGHHHTEHHRSSSKHQQQLLLPPILPRRSHTFSVGMPSPPGVAASTGSPAAPATTLTASLSSHALEELSAASAKPQTAAASAPSRAPPQLPDPSSPLHVQGLSVPVN